MFSDVRDVLSLMLSRIAGLHAAFKWGSDTWRMHTWQKVGVVLPVLCPPISMHAR